MCMQSVLEDYNRGLAVFLEEWHAQIFPFAEG